MTAREEVLSRIRFALGAGAGAAARPPGRVPQAGGAPQEGRAAQEDRAALPDGAAAPARYRTRGGMSQSAMLELLAGRLSDYRAIVRWAAPGQLAGAIAAALATRGARRLVVPPGLALPPLPAGVQVVADTGFTPQQLDAFDGVITGAAAAIAETGTIILDGSPDQGRRAISLVPDYHLCLLAASRVVALVPEALGLLHPERPLTWISGPSATSDIELRRVEGVHGPRTLEVVVVGQRASE